MKITMTRTWATPQGIARAGTVLDLEKQVAEELLSKREGNEPAARPYDHQRDAKKPFGLRASKEYA